MSETRKIELTEQEIIDRGTAVLESSLPPGWEIARLELQPGQRNRRDDAMLQLRSQQPGWSATILVEAKKSFAPRDVGDVLGGRAELIRQVSGQAPVLVMAPWLSDRSRLLLEGAGFNYVDLSGNVRLVLSQPAVFLERAATNQKAPATRRTAGLRGAKAGRVVRLLADVGPPYGVVDLARAAGVTPGYVSKLLEWLDREAIVERSRRGTVYNVDWQELLRRRAETYSVFEVNAVSRYVCANGPAWALEQARDLRITGQVRRDEIALTGSLAVEQLVSVAEPSLLILYMRNDTKPLLEQLARLIPAEEGTNVMLATAYDDVIFDRPFWPTLPLKPLVQFVACSQLVLDSLTGSGRMPAEGEALMRWMNDNEDRWRKSNLSEAQTS